MHAPAIVIIVLLAVDLTVNLVKHGEPRGKFNAGTALIRASIWVVLFWWAGLFPVTL